MDKKVLSALIGLVGAIGNNGKTKDTDMIIRKAFLSDSEEDLAEMVRREKYQISPNCETCKSPCGNTSDYPLDKFDLWTKEQQDIKYKVLDEVRRITNVIPNDQELPEVVYKAISSVGYDLQENSYLKILEEMKAW